MKPPDATADPPAPSDRWPIPAEWRWARIAELGNVKLGRQLAATKRRQTISTPYLRAANITVLGLDTSEVLRMDLTEQERDSFRLVRGDVLLSEASGSPAHVGKGALWNDEIPDCCFQNTVIRFRSHAILPEYALLVFRYFLIEGVFARSAHGVGIQHLGASRFSQMEVPVPSAAEQGHIVEEVNRRLDRVATAESSLKSAVRGVEEQISTVIEAAATGQLGAVEGSSSSGRNHAKTEVVPFARIAIPNSWTWSTVREVGEAKKGKVREPRHEQGDNIKEYLRVANVLECRIDASDLLSMNFTPAEQEVYLLQDGDVLLNEGQSPNLIGRPAIYRGTPPSVCFQNTLIRFRAGELVNPEFALIVFRHYLRAGVFQAVSKWTTNLAHLGLQRFAELPFPLPPRAEQDELVALAQEKERQLEEQRATILASLPGVKQMMREILTAAVRGELIPRESGDESAEDMLSRLGPPPKEQRQPRGSSADDAEDEQESDRDLAGALKHHGGRSSAEDLFANAGYDRDLTREVEGFYLALRDSLGKTIQPAGSDEGRSMLEVLPDAT